MRRDRDLDGSQICWGISARRTPQTLAEEEGNRRGRVPPRKRERRGLSIVSLNCPGYVPFQGKDCSWYTRIPFECLRSHRMRKFTLFATFLLGASIGATGQEDYTGGLSFHTPSVSGSPRAATAGFATTPWQLAVGYQYSRLNLRGAFNPFITNGLNVSVTRYFGRALGIEVEAGSGFGTVAPGDSAVSFFLSAGPHISYRRHSRFEPWVHGLAGPEHFNFGRALFPAKTTAVAWIAGGGLDYRFESGFALRLQGDYLGSHFGGAYQRNLQVVGTVVWNF